MSTKSNPEKTKSNPEVDISSSDMAFLFECLRNLDESKNVDLVNVADIMGYTNVQSVGNRFRNLRKKHGINLDCKSGGTVKGKGAAKDTKSDDTAPAPAPATKTRKGSKAKAAEEADDAEETPAASGVDSPKVVLSPAKKTRARKGAKVSAKPIPATGPVNKIKDSGNTSNGMYKKKSSYVANTKVKRTSNWGVNLFRQTEIAIMQEEALLAEVMMFSNCEACLIESLADL
ncbi:hypothetical protein ASPWEDRAFT_25649 [Aspergillus wentii DTO 134E9]|uniref:Uncharacterized protein n=1 Tax=Aspergillus wentii DTO 134E9 TaxID=1073089 RepID=A0A1L9RYE2_ASPWE|nr:uncharacterized protein ASPWEDRAFT_25649 [Aspergillus wentii DTO 134E9]KAI9931475.1 hypothetical protein MW887_010050 [Aspergillus wentii]OJJ39857.1 hypothetical protein ASPWEDRAFT_25649 [Aspergillus wentii DTO 134E9]